jgi:hypothetical protein
MQDFGAQQSRKELAHVSTRPPSSVAESPENQARPLADEPQHGKIRKLRLAWLS